MEILTSPTFKVVKKVTLTVVGVLVVIAGIVMLVIPGPGILVIAAGLGILAIEFPKARELLDKGRSYCKKLLEQWRESRQKSKES